MDHLVSLNVLLLHLPTGGTLLDTANWAMNNRLKWIGLEINTWFMTIVMILNGSKGGCLVNVLSHKFNKNIENEKSQLASDCYLNQDTGGKKKRYKTVRIFRVYLCPNLFII